MRAALGLVALGLVALGACGTPNPAKPDAGLVQVVRIVDGDTVVLMGGEKVRVIGIDTPETVSPKVKPECGGQDATDFAEKYLLNRKVRVVLDDTQGERDHYERLLAYLEIDGKVDYGEVMIQNGLAREYTYGVSYARQLDYQKRQATARADKVGTWGKCGGFDVPAQK